MSRMSVFLPVAAMLYLAMLIACDAQGQPVVTIPPEQVREIAEAVAQEGVEIPDAADIAPAVQATLTSCHKSTANNH